jgi:hypothetical protein
MPVLEIPLSSEDPAFSFRVILEEVEISVYVHWNQRHSRWYIHFYDNDQAPLLFGLPLNINRRLLDGYLIEGLPPGDIVLTDLSGKNLECGRDELGDRCKLYYITSEELVE